MVTLLAVDYADAGAGAPELVGYAAPNALRPACNNGHFTLEIVHFQQVDVLEELDNLIEIPVLRLARLTTAVTQ